jgi:hypothetical protein
MSQEEGVVPARGPAVDPSATADAAAGVPDSPVQARLEDQIEVLVSQEHAAWASHREEASKQMGGEK